MGGSIGGNSDGSSDDGSSVFQHGYPGPSQFGGSMGGNSVDTSLGLSSVDP